MSKSITVPSLNLGNQIYLYRLLRDALGCGKQAFITQVEEALANADMAAYDLGFDDTRALLEAMGDCIKLTVFKGGRVYATVIANEAWDAALEKADQPKQKEAGKKLNPRKKKKGDKALKPIKPKHVKRAEPEITAEVEVKVEDGNASSDQAVAVASETSTETQTESDSAAQSAVESEPAAETEQATTSTVKPQPRNGEIFSLEEEPEAVEETTVGISGDAEQVAEPTLAEPEPAISLTVIYDPENANAGVQTWESKPVQEQRHETAAEVGAEAAEKAALDNEAKGEATKPSSIADPAEDVAVPAIDTESTSPSTAEAKAEPRPETEAKTESKSELEHKPSNAVKDKPSEKAEHASAPKHSRQPKAQPEHKATEKAEQKVKSFVVTEPPATAAVQTHAVKAAPAPKENAAHKPASPVSLPVIPEDYPTDFAAEVFCPGPLLHELSLLLPYGADAMGIVGEYYWIARERGTIQASRNRATFALRYTKDGERHETGIRIRRNTAGGLGAPWAIDKIETA